MKGCLCKAKSSLQHLVAKGCISWCSSYDIAFMMSLPGTAVLGTQFHPLQGFTWLDLGQSQPGIRQTSFEGKRERAGIPHIIFFSHLAIPVQVRVTAPTLQLGDAAIFGGSLHASCC